MRKKKTRSKLFFEGARDKGINGFLKELLPKIIYKSNASLPKVLDYHLDEEHPPEYLKSDFQIERKLASLDVLTDEEIGREGESAIDAFLLQFQKEMKEYELTTFDFKWVNSTKESFQPYDFFLEAGGYNPEDKEGYVDVKTTRGKQGNYIHVSIREARFLLDNFEKYYFFRVFPLEEGKKYEGIRVSHDLGMNIYKFQNKFKEEFESAINEMRTSRGKGFMTKPEWLELVVKEDYVKPSDLLPGETKWQYQMIQNFIKHADPYVRKKWEEERAVKKEGRIF